MPQSYLGDRSWSDISREERLFCSELFHAISGDERAFVRWLGAQPGCADLGLDPALSWEAAYEVCFYRDLLYASGKRVNQTSYSNKRTFDLCLFSPRDIVILEAKAQAGFDSKQNADFERDKQDVLRAIADAGHTARGIRVTVIALASSRYFDNVRRYGRGIPGVFDGHFSWRDVHEGYAAHALFARADAVYGC